MERECSIPRSLKVYTNTLLCEYYMISVLIRGIRNAECNLGGSRTDMFRYCDCDCDGFEKLLRLERGKSGEGGRCVLMMDGCLRGRAGAAEVELN